MSVKFDSPAPFFEVDGIKVEEAARHSYIPSAHLPEPGGSEPAERRQGGLQRAGQDDGGAEQPPVAAAEPDAPPERHHEERRERRHEHDDRLRR